MTKKYSKNHENFSAAFFLYLARFSKMSVGKLFPFVSGGLRLCAFEFDFSEGGKKSDSILIFIGGMTDGLLSPPCKEFFYIFFYSKNIFVFYNIFIFIS